MFLYLPTETVYLPNNVALVSKTFYSASFSCNFYLFSYPFDTQMCSVLIELDSADTSVVNFIVGFWYISYKE